MSDFKTAGDLASIFAQHKELPKTPCVRCGTVYRGKEDGFVCSDCIEKEKNKKQEEVNKNKRINYLIANSFIPKRYITAVFKPFNSVQKEVAYYLVDNFGKRPLDTSRDVLVMGNMGTGKTYLSCAFAIEMMSRKQINVKYTTEQEIISLFTRKEFKQLNILKNAQILIVDEVGKRRDTPEWLKIEFEELLSYRFNEMKPTVYLTNLIENDFYMAIGERMTDRLRETDVMKFVFDGDSLRGRG